MRALLDVNVLIALLDRDHVHHQQASNWFLANVEAGWASCAMTQNGCLRVLSQPNYPSAVPVVEVASRLAEFTANAVHQFWPGTVSLLDTNLVNLGYSHGAKQLTDIYLLALATANKGRLVTFDQRISLKAVHGATVANLVTI